MEPSQADAQLLASALDSDAADYALFLEDGFNPQEYASKFLGTSVLVDAQSKQADSSLTDRIGMLSVSDSDLSVTVSRLSLSINEIEQHIHSLITDNAPEFLRSISRVDSLQKDILSIQRRINSLAQRSSSAQQETHNSLAHLREFQSKLEELQCGYQLATDVHRFISVSARFEGQMNTALDFDLTTSTTDTAAYQEHGTNLVATAKTLRDICRFIDELEVSRRITRVMDIETCSSIASLLPEAAQLLYERIEDLLLAGLRVLSPVILQCSVQAALHLCKLDALVRNLLGDLTDVICDRIRMAMDLRTIGAQLQETHRMSPLTSAEYCVYLVACRLQVT